MCHSNGCGCGCGRGMGTLKWVAKVLLIVGGLNWGLVGVGMLVDSAESWNVVKMVLGSVPVAEALVYLLVGLSAVWKLFGGCRCGKCRGVCMNCSHTEKSETRV